MAFYHIFVSETVTKEALATIIFGAVCPYKPHMFVILTYLIRILDLCLCDY
jgi:hypothetical protein